MSANLRGALWILLSCAATTVMSVGVRALAPAIHPAQIAFCRCLVGLAVMLPVVLHSSGPRLTTRRWRLHLLRGVLAVLGINCGYYSLTVMPLATATTLFFTAPLFVTVLAPALLGETVGRRRWCATLIGFAGTMVVVGFNPGGFDPAMLVAVAAALTLALSLIAGKSLSASESPATILFYFGVITSIGSLPPALAVWRAPTWTEAGLLVLVGVFATARSYCDIRGYAIGEASFVAPFLYVRLILMAGAGYVLYAEVPAPSALAGAAVIIASALYIARREARSPAARAVAVRPP